MFKKTSIIFLLFFSLAFSSDYRVREVIDGDTVKLTSGVHLRYIGIDAPEQGESLFQQAKSENEKMTLGKKIRVEFDKEKKDKYNRILAYVFVDSLMVQKELLKRGLAYVYSYAKNQKYLEQFIKIQREAKKKKVGLWGLPLPKLEKYYVGNSNSKRFHRAKCPLTKNMRKINRIFFENRDQPFDLGYSPCRYCQP
jgi:micrococcal nuclease